MSSSLSDRVNVKDTKCSASRDIGLKRRYRAEKRFKAYGIGAICIGLGFLAILFSSIVAQGIGAFRQTTIELPIHFDSKVLDPHGKATKDNKVLFLADYSVLVRNALAEILHLNPNDIKNRAALNGLYSANARIQLREMLLNNPALLNTTQKVKLLASANLDMAYKGKIDFTLPEQNRQFSDKQHAWMQQLDNDKLLSRPFNKGLFVNGASSRPEMAGLGAALLGTAYMMLIVLLLALPLGVLASLYLEEYAKKNWFTDLIEVNINNLAAVPSIVFGILGLAVFINFFGMPRSASLVGGLVLSLMTLPAIIISTRSSLRAVPPSIRAAALGIGASKNQMIFHHVLPLALPGILTGTLIGVARAIGETAPLLLIGMVAFIKDYPLTPLDPATALPVQIYMWAAEPERAFVEKSSAAIMVLLLFLLILYSIITILRQKFEKR